MIENLLEGGGLVFRIIILAMLAILAGQIAHWILFRILKTIGRRDSAMFPIDRLMIQHTSAPLRLLFPLIGLYIVYPIVSADLANGLRVIVSHTLYILIVAALTWLFVKLATVLQEAIVNQFDVDKADNLMARKMRTQVSIIRRILVFVIVFMGISAVLLRFEGFRQLGTGLLASAGVVGIIVGFAAQKTLGNVLAGIQIAISQPIRVDDVVVVEGEWGRIEEITLTYVVVRIWDQRRLVLPISYFIEQPFQNWTRTSAEILGTVFLYMDYTVPFDAVRQELERLLQDSEHWDGKVWRMHVTDATERTVQLRCLMSAVDSATAWELRCEIREKLVAFIQREYPGALPVIRAAVDENGRDNAD